METTFTGTEGQVIRCKAAVAWEAGKPLSIEDVEVAPPKAHEVRIKVVATGVCHTDWEYLYENKKGMRFRPFPLVLGHEAAGIVESVGPQVTKFAAGDQVIPLFLPQCQECDRCLSPKTNLCKRAKTQVGVLADGTSRISCKRQQIYQFLGVSSFSQYTVVPDTSLAKINSNAPLDKVFLLGCGVSTGYGAALKTGKVERDSVCAVFGLGAVGLAAVMGCKAAGAKTIIGVDVNPNKFEKAIMLGATECVNPNDDSKSIQEVLVEKTNGGVDYALECVGSPVVMSAALESTTDAWGVCVIAGWTETESMSVVVEKLLMGRTLTGTYFGGWKSVEGVFKLVEDYMEKKLKLDEFITHDLPLNQINQAFETLKSGTSIRTLIRLWEKEAPAEEVTS
ncbi:alcohol dehydrogenase class-3 isoform X2 [Larimichthys crocea]|uniref:alcohol dehydrogenase class-3 isoform X2 n=1 Tax=Larimichthys crocea TaxID=215358 RepID=UPI000901DCB5|nr:alcohol dehydrogenase class-3 isoform X2 [Larimichthys crocea]